MKPAIALVLALALLVATSTTVVAEPTSLTTEALSNLAKEIKKSHPAPFHYVKCKKTEECCTFDSSPVTECRLCVAAGHCP